MQILKIIHLIIAFLLEMAMVIAIGHWGFQQGKNTGMKYLLAILLPAIVMILWGIFAAPKSSYRLELPVRLIFAGSLFALTTIALYKTGHISMAFMFAVFAFASLLTSFLIKL